MLLIYQTSDSLAEAIQTFSANRYSEEKIREHAQQFSITAFHKNLKSELEKILS